MNITAKMVADLREKTGAGMMDCKKALVAADGDMELAIENLRKSGVAKAEKKSGRATEQGKVWTKIAGDSAAVVEMLCETDFAAKTPKFGALVDAMLDGALKIAADGDVAAAVNEQEAAIITSHIATIGENMQIRRVCRYQGAADSTFAGYHHNIAFLCQCACCLYRLFSVADGKYLFELFGCQACQHIINDVLRLLETWVVRS